jgi:menaquinol-cytochrome c reductase iron-sulfur subunit
MPHADSEKNPTPPASDDSRRGFGANIAAVCLGVLAFAGPVCAAVVSFLNPLKLKGQGGRFFFLTTLESLPEDGTPRRFPVIADRVDGWITYPDEPIGAVLMRRTGDKEKPVEAFNVICPHAGCFIGYNPDGKEFFCPCHEAHFSLDGKRTDKNSPSPRDMDTLQVEVREKGEVWVKFENFQLGTSAKTVKA